MPRYLTLNCGDGDDDHTSWIVMECTGTVSFSEKSGRRWHPESEFILLAYIGNEMFHGEAFAALFSSSRVRVCVCAYGSSYNIHG